MTSAYVVWAPTRAEAACLRRGLTAAGEPGVALVPTGAGRQRAERAARDLRAQSGAQSDARPGAPPAVAVAGIAGGLDPSLVPGDVIVATEVRGADRVVTCPSAPLLAARLRRFGLTVRTGPVLSRDHIVTGAERRTLHRTGALAVDMESAWSLAGLPAETPTACVRVIADPATRPLLRPVTVAHLRTALRTLTRVAPALATWGSAIRPRRVLLPSPRSFCAGVERAIHIVERVLEQQGAPVYVRKQIVHNVHVVRRLEALGAVFVEELDEVPDGATVVFSAHGVAPAVRTDASVRGLSVVDATCPLVAKVHSEARRFADRGDTVLFIGHAGHEETEGTIGERPDSTLLVEDLDAARGIEVPDPARVSYLVQTTLAVDEVAEIVDVLHERFESLQAPGSDDICYATTNRQHALRSVADEADLVLVVGSQNSSNSNRLVELADRMGTPAHLIDDAGDIDLAWLTDAGTIAITAGASAPMSLVEETVEAIRGLGPVDLLEREVTTEDIQFTLPKEVRQP
ncbi:4-hydroxy-3-methylbut-2-enyl diphosphate reductase [Actinopolymorpha pittospori]|uniref:4-hydroxy-3-methylbut-2-enyl diphosphate reductase n=1 Tax=Actinopolymorpha pittospori TaxID=648752 RepID=A0A927MZX4_9ACTN|nr:4-hydroxy-3-methylbut-2-enyl diphosphate reductase [Actinopolymorpha pittospori]MBE1606175.1 4-hydroxy-3-methylbut-2-enyl diphosphate reductase [Actinopolymorpha pittospori]